MSEKTIEVVSIHKGEINLTLKSGEPRKVNFDDKGTVGFAMVDHDEAEILLGIGRPHYWKPGSETTTAGAALSSDTPSVPTSLTKDTYDSLPNVKTLQDLLAACSDVPLVMELIAIESQRPTPRKSWMSALDERHKVLTTPASGAAGDANVDDGTNVNTSAVGTGEGSQEGSSNGQNTPLAE